MTGFLRSLETGIGQARIFCTEILASIERRRRCRALARELRRAKLKFEQLIIALKQHHSGPSNAGVEKELREAWSGCELRLLEAISDPQTTRPGFQTLCRAQSGRFTRSAQAIMRSGLCVDSVMLDRTTGRSPVH